MEEIIVIGYKLAGLFLLLILCYSIGITASSIENYCDSFIDLNRVKKDKIILENRKIKKQLNKKENKR